MRWDELVDLAVKGENPSPEKVLEHFANRDHWTTTVVGTGRTKRAVWVWIGPNIPPFELPARVLKALEGES